MSRSAEYLSWFDTYNFRINCRHGHFNANDTYYGLCKHTAVRGLLSRSGGTVIKKAGFLLLFPSVRSSEREEKQKAVLFVIIITGSRCY